VTWASGSQIRGNVSCCRSAKGGKEACVLDRTGPSPAATPQQLARIAGFIWGIADDVLRDLYVRGKYRDVILPMTVLRRFG